LLGTSFCTAAAIGCVFFGLAIYSLHTNGISIRQDFADNPLFGEISRYDVILPLRDYFPSLKHTIDKNITRTSAIVANFPQVALSFMYVASLKVLNRQHIAHAFLKYITIPKNLRVSDPEIDLSTAKGEPTLSTQLKRPHVLLWKQLKWLWSQCVTLWMWLRRKPIERNPPSTEFLFQRQQHLTLPGKYQYSLVLAKVALHWAFSQSIFVLGITTWGPGPAGVHLVDFDSAAIGWSAMGIMISIILGCCVFIFLLAHGVRKYPCAPRDLTRLVCDSNALALMSQTDFPTTDDTQDLALQRVKLGVVRHFRDVSNGHIGFGLYNLETPVPGIEYDIPVLDRPPWRPRFAGRIRAIRTALGVIGRCMKSLWKISSSCFEALWKFICGATRFLWQSARSFTSRGDVRMPSPAQNLPLLRSM
jgi:hypothetical protein